MKYRLKTGVADFTVVDGAFEGRSYKAGETYDEVPPEEKHKFETVAEPAPIVEQPVKTKGKGSQEGGTDK